MVRHRVELKERMGFELSVAGTLVVASNRQEVDTFACSASVELGM